MSVKGYSVGFVMFLAVIFGGACGSVRDAEGADDGRRVSTPGVDGSGEGRVPPPPSIPDVRQDPSMPGDPAGPLTDTEDPKRDLTPCEKGQCTPLEASCDRNVDFVVSSGNEFLVKGTCEVKSLTIQEGGSVKASRNEGSTLIVHGNLIVEGVLDYGNASDRIEANAEIVFASLDDFSVHGIGDRSDGKSIITDGAGFQATDRGVWVRKSGVVSAAGKLKRAWAFLLDGAQGSDLTVEVEDATGWEVGDTVVLTPSMPRDEAPSGYSTQDMFDELTVQSIEGNVVALAGSVRYAHDGCADCFRRAEAINLTRNVSIHSDGSGRTHLAVIDDGVMQLDSVEVYGVGPGTVRVR